MTSLFSTIVISGPDARTFLQGQLSCDMDRLTREAPLLACVNSAQGRVQAVLFVSERDQGVAVSVVAPVAERTIERLRKYILRSKVKIDWAAGSAAPAPSSPTEDSLLSQLRAGIPHVFPETHEAFVAQMLNLDLLGAISFNKGCYTGQEIIARTHYRGAIKRRMFRFEADGLPPAPGTRLLVEGAHAGDVVYAAPAERGSEILAVVNLAQVDSVIQLEDRPGDLVQRLDLPYSVRAAS